MIKVKINSKEFIKSVEKFRANLDAFSKSSKSVKNETWAKIGNLISRTIRDYYKENIIGSQTLADSTKERKTRAARNKSLLTRGADGSRKLARSDYKGVSGISETYGIETGFLMDKLGAHYPVGSEDYMIRRVKTTSNKIKNNTLEIGINYASFKNEYPKYISKLGDAFAKFSVTKAGILSLSTADYEFILKALYNDTIGRAFERAFGRQFG